MGHRPTPSGPFPVTQLTVRPSGRLRSVRRPVFAYLSVVAAVLLLLLPYCFLYVTSAWRRSAWAAGWADRHRYRIASWAQEKIRTSVRGAITAWDCAAARPRDSVCAAHCSFLNSYMTYALLLSPACRHNFCCRRRRTTVEVGRRCTARCWTVEWRYRRRRIAEAAV